MKLFNGLKPPDILKAILLEIKGTNTKTILAYSSF